MGLNAYNEYMFYDHPKEKTKQNYSIISPLYITDFGNEYINFELVDKFVQLQRQRRLLIKNTLDLGCGPGTITDYLIKKGVWSVVAVDITPEFCEYVREKFKDLKGAYVEVIEGDMVDVIKEIIPGYRNNIGGVVAGFSIIHIPDNEVDELLRNIYTLLAPGGLFYMSCHEGTFKGMEIEPYVQQGDTRLRVQERLEIYMNYFTEEELRDRITRAGFTIIDLIHTKPQVIPGEIPVTKLQVLAEKSLPPEQKSENEPIGFDFTSKS